MSVLVAKQSHFASLKVLGHNEETVKYAIPRCRCQPNTCSRPVCKGCVQCLRRNPGAVSKNTLLADFFGI